MTTGQQPIVQLSEAVSNQIAAGEVVERPASVVKELVENSIDAGATRIAVTIEQGGLQAIKVTDNGIGLEADQVSLAFERHATSKIRTADDLFSIHTLGFRGEALPSIASVSHVTLRTKTRTARMGTEIRLEGGRRIALEPKGTPEGTTITVARLFFNTPARRKFLKSESGERRAITDLLTKIALAHPSIQIVYEAEGREVFRTPGDGDLAAAAGAVYGFQLARTLLPIEKETPFGSVGGLVAPPAEAKGNRRHMSIFVNGRWVESRALMVAVERGYNTLLPSRRFPVAIIRLEIDPSLVDVNVHPAKTEVRFRDERAIFSGIVHAVREALLGANLFASPEPPPFQRPAEELPTQTLADRLDWYPKQKEAPRPQEPEQIVWRDVSTGDGPITEPPFRGAEEVASAQERANDNAPLYEIVDRTTGEVRERPPTRSNEHWRDPLRPREQVYPSGPSDANEARHALREAVVIGQVLNTYMVVPVPWGLWLVDQHVAHERILFEQTLAMKDKPVDVQPLLVPLHVDLPVQAMATLEELHPTLTEMGFEIEHFGGQSVLVRSVPAEFSERTHFIPGVLEEMTELYVDGRTEERRERLAAMIACKGAVKAGQRLELSVMKSLLQRLAETENPFACPHGRPIVVELSQAELERRFGRR